MTDTQGLVVCELCGHGHEPGEIISHLRREHGVTDDLERWPDGVPIVLDTTLDPKDFT